MKTRDRILAARSLGELSEIYESSPNIRDAEIRVFTTAWPGVKLQSVAPVILPLTPSGNPIGMHICQTFAAQLLKILGPTNHRATVSFQARGHRRYSHIVEVVGDTIITHSMQGDGRAWVSSNGVTKVLSEKSVRSALMATLPQELQNQDFSVSIDNCEWYAEKGFHDKAQYLKLVAICQERKLPHVARMNLNRVKIFDYGSIMIIPGSPHSAPVPENDRRPRTTQCIYLMGRTQEWFGSRIRSDEEDEGSRERLITQHRSRLQAETTADGARYRVVEGTVVADFQESASILRIASRRSLIGDDVTHTSGAAMSFGRLSEQPPTPEELRF